MKVDIVVTDNRISGENLPEYKTSGSAAFDLRACSYMPYLDAGDETLYPLTRPHEIHAGDEMIFTCGFRFFLNNSSIAGLQLIRSGLGRRGLELNNSAGLYDSDYQGDVFVHVRNKAKSFVTDTITINPLDRIAQMCIFNVVQVDLKVVRNFQEATLRGEGGHGSTGES